MDKSAATCAHEWGVGDIARYCTICGKVEDEPTAAWTIVADAPGRWFRRVWDAMPEGDRQAVRAKARWEQRSLSAVLVDWPSPAPEELRGLIPAPERTP